MNKAPKIGARVTYPGGLTVGPCTGTVTKVYVKHLYPEDFDWESDDVPPIIGNRPEREWKVAMKVDGRPDPWPYGNADKFCPDVGEVDPA